MKETEAIAVAVGTFIGYCHLKLGMSAEQIKAMLAPHVIDAGVAIFAERNK